MSALRLIAIIVLSAAATAARADETYESWPQLVNPFPSTGGNGVMIDGYDPIVRGGACATNFTAIMPDGARYNNIAEFTATPTQGGVLCHDGRWRAADGSASGTTPFRVFIKDGIVRRPPD